MQKWENPELRSENLMAAHAAFQEERVSLSGRWRFLSQNADAPAPEGWETPEFDDKKWKRLNVPGSWEEAEVCAGDAQTENLAGFYRRSFTLAKDQGSRQIILRFACVSACALVWVNGTYIGMTKLTRTAAEFDITANLRPEKNFVCVQVLRYSDLTPQKEQRFSGILGDVELYSLPPKAITDIQTEARWQEDGTPLLIVNLRTRNADGFTARIALMDGNQVVGYCESAIQEDAASAVISCKAPRLWTAETPELYRVAVILWDGVAMYHTREVSFGFRRMVMENGTLTWNGQPEKVFAVSYIPGSETLEQDLKAIKDHNFNAVSLSAPVPEELYGLCDKLGLYVLEAPETVIEEQRQRLEAVYCNHPSILPMDEMNIRDVSSLSRVDQALEKCLEAEQPSLFCFSAVPENMEEIVQMIRTESRILGGIFRFWKDAANREAKAVLQPMNLRFEDGTLTVENLSRFLDSGDYDCHYILTRDGETVVEKPLSLNAAPGGSASVSIETKYDIYKPGRYYLTAQFRRKDGTVIASNQWPVAQLKHIYDENPGGTIREDSGSILLRSQDATYVIGRASGALEQIRMEEKDLLTSPLLPVFADLPVASSGLRIPSEWEKLTTRKKKLKPSVFEVDQMTRTVTASFHLGSGLMQTYRLHSDGSLAVELRLRTGRTAPDRLGVPIPVSTELNRFRWFGLGPDDAVPGHEAGRFFDIHEQALTDQESRKEPVFTLDLTDETGLGIHVRSEDGLRVKLIESCLTLELPVSDLKPHTTYTFGFTINPIK